VVEATDKIYKKFGIGGIHQHLSGVLCFVDRASGYNPCK